MADQVLPRVLAHTLVVPLDANGDGRIDLVTVSLDNPTVESLLLNVQ